MFQFQFQSFLFTSNRIEQENFLCRLCLRYSMTSQRQFKPPKNARVKVRDAKSLLCLPTGTNKQLVC